MPTDVAGRRLARRPRMSPLLLLLYVSVGVQNSTILFCTPIPLCSEKAPDRFHATTIQDVVKGEFHEVDHPA